MTDRRQPLRVSFTRAPDLASELRRLTHNMAVAERYLAIGRPETAQLILRDTLRPPAALPRSPTWRGGRD
jgi:hypothetical protein